MRDEPDPRTAIVFLGLLGAGLLFVAYSLYADVDASGARVTTFLPFLLLFVALLIALGRIDSPQADAGAADEQILQARDQV